MKDLEKRKRVMQRSMRLGHCVCDPRKSCPCDALREMDLCPCAGERPETPPGPVRLTSLVEHPGCASKIDQATLAAVLRGQLDPKGDLSSLDTNIVVMQILDAARESARTGKTVRLTRLGP